MAKYCLLILYVAFLMLAGRTDIQEVANLPEIYNQAASNHGPWQNPVIVIPGVMGSKLIDSRTNTPAWGAYSGHYVNPSSKKAARLSAIPMRKGDPLSQLTDEIAADGALDRVKFNFLILPVEVVTYAQVLASLGVGGYQDENIGHDGPIDYGENHFTCFQFAYDWRRDNVENAILLSKFIMEKRRYIQDKYEKQYGIKNADIKFDIVAHSMGGLVTRYYLRYGGEDLPADGTSPEVTWKGAQYVESAILVATPNAGSVLAFDKLLHGFSLGPVGVHYDSAILATMPSLYQILPRPRHGAILIKRDGRTEPADIYDPALWDQMGWGLVNPEQDKILARLLPDAKDASKRRDIAMDHLEKCLTRARRFHEALDSDASPPEGFQLRLVAGDSQNTPAIIEVTKGSKVKVVEYSPGDGLVTRTSALMDERINGDWQPKLVSPVKWADVTFLFEDHMGLMSAPVFTDNVLYFLLEKPR